MWNLYQHVKDLIIGESANESIEHQRQSHGRPTNLQTRTECTNTEASGRTGQRRHFTGTVTAISGDSGMIDNCVYFDFHCIVGGRTPFVGGAAHVTATRVHELAGWRASRVDLMSEWRPEEGSQTELVVGVVAGVSRTKCVIESGSREVTFEPSECRLVGGYYPQVGDSIEVELLHQDRVVAVNTLRPLREQTLTGTVSRISHGNGIINDDIYFTMSSCCRGYQPLVGDSVSVVCVECVRHQCNWRACSVKPDTQDSSESNSACSDSSFPLPCIPLLNSKQPILDLPSRNCPDPESVLKQDRSPRKLPNFPKSSYHSKVMSCRIPGQRPQKRATCWLPNHLGEYRVPDDLREAVEGGEWREMALREPVIQEPLCMENYSQKFSFLLFIEEIQREIDIRQFDLSCVVLDRCGPYFSLSVPGLSEGRPSLLVGDKIIVCEHDMDELGTCWEGYIHEIRRDGVMVKFADVFHTAYTSWDVDIMFTFGRTPLRRMHHVVEMCDLIGACTLFPRQPTPKPPLLNFTFPSQSKVTFPSSIPDHCLINRHLNFRQRAAVMRIIKAQCRPSPYVLFGPPGTGKTVTLVEAILQVHRLSRGSRILVCAPSNSAADIIAERLHDSRVLRVGEMVRLNAVQRQAPPTSLEPYCLDTDSINIASKKRVVVATCVTAGGLHRLNLSVGHFTHVFVDEAGQATEPECLLPISLAAANSNAVIVLVGDPCQLGPVLSSRLAGSSGLGISFLERVMEIASYCRQEEKFKGHGCYDPLLVTKLIDTYRSHGDILRPYSEMFYHGELVPKAVPTISHVMCQWEELPRKGFPVIFHGLESEDMQEGNSPSWFNPIEALQVLKYVQALKDNATYAPKPSEIGVVTPYRKQVEKICLLLGNVVGGEAVKVGSVEEFQGQERAAIIITTVRSAAVMVESDVRHNLGFLSNPKRFNVAISRAQALLVVIGNPHLLVNDPCWSKFIQYVVEKGGYRGCPLPHQLKRASSCNGLKTPPT